MNFNDTVLKRICSEFRLEGDFCGFEVVTCGNINHTFKVCYKKPDGTLKEYLVQCINHYVFKDPAAVMRNIDLVTTHLAARCGDMPRLHFHHTDSGMNYCFDGSNYWRLSNWTPSVTFNSSDDIRIIRSTGKAFGRFQSQLTDFDASLLTETIPDFHNTKKRLETFFEDVKADPCGRAHEIMAETEYISEVTDTACKLNEMLENGELPLRVTHNDTKINNVLFDENTLEPLLGIDLDTVMPGLSAYDFGDAVRFGANTTGEDEKDLSKVALDLGKYNAFASGFLSETNGILTDDELRSLPLGAFSITIELASRFLDDYLTGDKYFKTNYQGHNLDRARCQIALAKDMMSKRDSMLFCMKNAGVNC